MVNWTELYKSRFQENLPSQRLGISDSMGSHHLRNKRLSSASIRNCFYGKSAGFAERRRRCQLAGKKGTQEATSAGDCSHGTSSFHVRLLMRGCSCRFRTILLAMNSFTSSSCHTKPAESRKMHSKVKERWRERERHSHNLALDVITCVPGFYSMVCGSRTERELCSMPLPRQSVRPSDRRLVGFGFWSVRRATCVLASPVVPVRTMPGKRRDKPESSRSPCRLFHFSFQSRYSRFQKGEKFMKSDIRLLTNAIQFDEVSFRNRCGSSSCKVNVTIIIPITSVSWCAGTDLFHPFN